MAGLDCAGGKDTFCTRHLNQSDISRRLRGAITPVDCRCEVFNRANGRIVKTWITERGRIQCDERPLIHRLGRPSNYCRGHVVDRHFKRVAVYSTIIIGHREGDRVHSVVRINMTRS